MRVSHVAVGLGMLWVTVYIMGRLGGYTAEQEELSLYSTANILLFAAMWGGFVGLYAAVYDHHLLGVFVAHGLTGILVFVLPEPELGYLWLYVIVYLVFGGSLTAVGLYVARVIEGRREE